MPHDFEGLEWASNRGDFSKSLADFFSRLMSGFERMNAIEFDAPWKAERASRQCIDL